MMKTGKRDDRQCVALHGLVAVIADAGNQDGVSVPLKAAPSGVPLPPDWWRVSPPPAGDCMHLS